MSDATAISPASSHWKTARSGILLFFGVALPIAALVVELGTRLNTQIFFDPIPTFFHAVLIAFVAGANGWCWFVVTRAKVEHFRRAALVNGFAMGIATFYSVLFLPLLPLAMIGILLYGLGALVWAPLASLIVALRLRTHLQRHAAGEGIEIRTWPGVVLGLAVLIALDVPGAITRVGAGMAMASNAQTRTHGMRLLRTFGSERVLLRMCYVRTGVTTDMLSLLFNMHRPVSPLAARELYYRATGRAFNSVPIPVDLSARRGLFDWGTFDSDQGAQAVGGRVHDLWLASSRIDGSVNADAALGYVEWTMVFRNGSPLQREARAQIALPPGAVVSRVTLWIDGEEREAAFAGRRQVRAAYQAVVQQRRDPVLVTTAGPDRILMQLFPVPPSGEMKVRIGMTVPLGLVNPREGVLRLPYFHERNFETREDLRHGVWIESQAKLRSALVASGGDAVRGDVREGVLRADVDDAHLAGRDASVTAIRSGESVAWVADMRSAEHVVRQVIAYNDVVSRPRLLAVVVDASGSMEDVADEIAKSLSTLPAGVDVRLIFADDEEEVALQGRSSLSGAAAARKIASFDYAGGHDNTAALVRALDLVSGQTDAVLLWVHGPQPELLGAGEALLQQLSRGAPLGRWYEVQVAPGANRVADTLDGVASIATLPPGDLEALVAAWRSGDPQVTVRRERVEMKSAGAMTESGRTSDHLVRLWANDEVARLMRSGTGREAEAIELAQRYQLVTPVSGAVVLETQQQYDAAGLTPVAEGTVPTIPEPEEWALIVIALLVLGYAYRRRHALITARAA